ncbi:MAG: hypothetical protein AB7T74_00445 [Clostridia bacterium]|jgi:hypothetical protein
MKGKIRILVLYVSLFLACTIGCGIDSISYLGIKDTPVFTSESPNALEFEAPSDPTSLYLGINLYYRIYDSETDAIADRNILDTRQGSDIIPGTAISYLENSLGYSRPAKYSLKNGENILVIPTIPETDIATEEISIKKILDRIYIDLDTTSTLESIEANPVTDDVFELLRITQTGILESFDQLPLIEDPDYKSGESEGFSLFVQFFAASYGFDLAGSSTEIYSNAVYLGRIVLDVEL